MDIIDEALGDGVILYQPDTQEPVEWFNEWKKESDKHWKEMLNSYYLERRNGQSLAQFIKVGDKLKLYSFSEDDYELEYDELTAEIVSGKSFLKIINSFASFFKSIKKISRIISNRPNQIFFP